MQESVVYQRLIQQRLQQGKQQEARAMIIRQLTRRLGAVAPQLREQIEALSIT